ncbi:MAG: radical SAM protein [Alphaproteobacteria bacterium]|nr:radical SAM protein [Alphaproteobacteria bacterium]
MTVEVRPLGVKCNIQCQYCYQNPQRDAGAVLHRYDLDMIKKAIAGLGVPFSVFGGEPLLMPVDDLEALWSWGFDRFGRNSLQTNGTLITNRHLDLFKRYNVRVGISIDGPGAFNDIRWAGTERLTRAATAKTEAAIGRLCDSGLTPGLIVTLHRNNATADKMDALLDWLKKLALLGIRSVRLHLLEVEDSEIRDRYRLTDTENTAALLFLASHVNDIRPIRLSMFEDIKRLLQGNDQKASCVWKGCDPYTTRAVQGIDGNGQRSNCGRTNKDGIDFVKGDQAGYERYLALYHTPRAFGGCSGCRFFAMCKGQCPGTAIDGDWRNRTEYCDVWTSIFEHFEAELQRANRWVLSRSEQRLKVEATLVDAWARGRNPSLTEATREVTASQ